jgi:hypothetical protein
MNKTLIIAFAAASIAAVPAFAADSSSGSSTSTQPQMKTEGQMNPTAGSGADGGVQPSQQPGAPTSNRSNEATPAPSTQVDKAPSGETSDRTPGNHAK